MPRSRLAQILGAVVTVVVLGGLWLIGPVLWVELDEAGVPSRPDAQSVPAGVQVVSEATECGSGGCWRDLTLSWPGHSRADLLAEFGLDGDLIGDACRPASWLDRRVVCIGAADRQPAAVDQASIYVQWHRPLQL